MPTGIQQTIRLGLSVIIGARRSSIRCVLTNGSLSAARQQVAHRFMFNVVGIESLPQQVDALPQNCAHAGIATA